MKTVLRYRPKLVGARGQLESRLTPGDGALDGLPRERHKAGKTCAQSGVIPGRGQDIEFRREPSKVNRLPMSNA